MRPASPGGRRNRIRRARWTPRQARQRVGALFPVYEEFRANGARDRRSYNPAPVSAEQDKGAGIPAEREPIGGSGFRPVDPKQSFPALEQRILKRWRENDVFHRQLAWRR